MREKVISKQFGYSKLKYSIILLIVFLFKDKIEAIYEDFVVIPILSFVKTNLFNDVIIGILICLIFFWYYKKWRNKFIYSKAHITALVVFFVFFLTYRNFYHRWVWTELYVFSTFKYADILFLPPVISAVIYLSNSIKRKTQKVGKSFETDRPITRSDDDRLNMSIYALELSNRIIGLHTEKSFAIGITGPYGSGKTSFMELVKQNLNKQKEKFIIIDFNPWMSRNEESIIEDFFDNISEEFQKYTSLSIKSINKYSRRLSEIDSSILAKTITLLNDSAGATNTLNDLFSQVNEIFRRLDRKVVIFIDDVDRLTYLEIFETLKLIRSTADFYNVTFIVSYDRSYVLSALRSSINQQSEYFLEKIFQVEFTLPYYEKNNLIKKLKEKLLLLTDDQFYILEIEDFVNGNEISGNSFIPDFIVNLRDITRLYNNLLLDYSLLKGEIIFKDLFYIELLKLKFPNIYELLFDRTFEIFENSKEHDSRNIILIDSYTNSGKEHNFPLLKILTSDKRFYGATEMQIDKIIKFLKSIFSERDYLFRFSDKPHLSIRNRNQFHTYNAFKVLEGNLSEVEYKRARNESLEQFCLAIKKWIDTDLRYALIFRLKAEKEFSSKDEFEKVIKAIFFLTKQQADFEIKTVYINYDENDLINKMYRIESIIKEFYNGEIEDYKAFVKSIFTNPQAPFIFEAAFIFHIIRHNYEFILDKEQLENIRLKYLRMYLEETSDFKDAWSFYWYCGKIERIATGSSTSKIIESANEQANEILVPFLRNKGLDWFLFEIITTGRNEPDTQIMLSVKTVLYIFGSMEKFENFLNEIVPDNWKYLNEFKAFFLECKKAGFETPIDFVFDVIPDKRLLE